MSDDLLHQAVADRHAAGDGEMGADRAGEFDEAEEARPAPINLGDPAHEPDDLGDDEDHVEDRARADRRHQRHPLRRRGDFTLGPVVEGAQKRAFGDVDEVAAVDDRAGGVLDLTAGVRRFGPVAVERDEPADEASRRLAVVGGAGGCEGDMHLGDFCLARNRVDLAREESGEADKEQNAEGEADQAQRLGPGEQALDQAGRP